MNGSPGSLSFVASALSSANERIFSATEWRQSASGGLPLSCFAQLNSFRWRSQLGSVRAVERRSAHSVISSLFTMSLQIDSRSDLSSDLRTKLVIFTILP